MCVRWYYTNDRYVQINRCYSMKEKEEREREWVRESEKKKRERGKGFTRHM